ncbi:hypothetical protein [Amycolatopsis kentuckyensis]|uniref:hypothetical protein n=1 Tax=Amycolatopsis kentuckyensis TaxID=218823 RepID=UPI003561414A
MTQPSAPAPDTQPKQAAPKNQPRRYAPQPNRVRTRNVAVGTGVLGGVAVATQSLLTLGPTATAVGGAATAAVAGGTVLAAKTRGRARRRATAAGPGSAARRSMIARGRQRAARNAAAHVGATRRMKKAGKPGIAGWSAGRRPRTGAATQRALAGQGARNGFWKPLGPQRRNARGQFASGHHAPGARPTTKAQAKAARKAAAARRRANKAIAPAAYRSTPSRRAQKRLNRSETRATNRRASAANRERRATAKADRRRRRQVKADNAHRNSSYRSTRSEVRSVERFGRRMTRLAGRIARIHRSPLGRGIGTFWMWTATRVGNGVRSASVLQALAVPFRDLFIRRPRPIPAVPVVVAVPAAATPKPADPLGMNLPGHPLTGIGLNKVPAASHPVSPAPTPVFGPGSGFGLVRRDTTTVTNQMDWSAMADAVRTWRPESPEDTQNFLSGMPDGLTELASALHAKSGELAAEFPYAATTADGLDALGNVIRAAAATADPQRSDHDAANATGQAFRDEVAHKPNAQHWIDGV